MRNITSIVLILLSVGIFFFLIDAQYKEIQVTQAQISENKETLEVAERLIERRKNLEEKFKQISRLERDELEKLLPDTVDNVRLIIDINNVAKQSGIVIKDIDIKKDEDETEESSAREAAVESETSIFEGIEGADRYVDTTKIGVISFSFSASVQHDTFLTFLEQLEQSKRIVDIRSIELNRTSIDSNNSIVYDYKVTFDTYWLK